MLQAVDHQIRTPPCTALAFEMLEKLISDSAMAPAKLNKFFWQWREYRENELNRETTVRLRRLAQRYTRRDLPSRLQRYVMDVEWLEWDESYRDRRNRRPSHAKALVRALAKRIALNPNSLREISHLLTQVSSSPGIWYFGEQLAVNDKAGTVLAFLTSITLHSAQATCLHGYLTGMKANSPDQFEGWLMQMLQSRDSAGLGAEMTLRSDYNALTFNRCLDALENGWLAPANFGALQFGTSLNAVPKDQAARLFCLIHERATPEALRLLIGLLDSLSDDQPVPCIPDLVFSVVLKVIPDLVERGQSFEFQWERVCTRLVKSNPELALPLLEGVLAAMGNDYRLRYKSRFSQQLIGIDPEGAWQVIANQFEATLPKWRSDLYSWLRGDISHLGAEEDSAPIADLPAPSILKWIDADPKERAALIAHAAPPTLDDEGGGTLTRQLLIRYGDIEGVRSGISASFHTGSWSGDMSLHLKQKRDMLRRWLSAGFDFEVLQWIELEIERHDWEIRREEINEERDRFA